MAPILGNENPESWIGGTLRTGRLERNEKESTPGKGRGRPAPDVPVTGNSDPEGKDPIDPVGAGDGARRRPRGGFQVVYRNLGRSEDRSRYEERSLSILINLDHPVLSAALVDSSVEDPGVRRLSYEIAFSEYAMALDTNCLNRTPTCRLTISSMKCDQVQPCSCFSCFVVSMTISYAEMPIISASACQCRGCGQ